MKILIVSSYFGKYTAGALHFIKTLSSELVRRGHSVSILMDRRYRSQFDVKGIKIIWFDSIHKVGYYSPSISFLKILLKINADVIHLNGYMSFQTDLGSLIAAIRKIPMILTPHGSLLAYKHITNSTFEKLPYFLHEFLTMKIVPKLAKYVIATSSAEYKDVVNFGIKPDKIKLIPLTINQKKISFSEKKYLDNKKKLLFVGRIVPNKNIEVLFYSLKEVLKEISNVELKIVGEEIIGRSKGDVGYKNKLVTLLNKLNLKENVKFVGWKTGDELWNIYNDSDLMLGASSYESFNFSLLEAASFGLPIISTDVGVAGDVVGNNQGGKIIDHDNPNQMTKAILEFLQDKTKYNKASNFICSRITNFSVSLITNKYEKAYLQVLGVKNNS